MSNLNAPDAQPNTDESTESFKDLLLEFEHSRARKAGDAGKQLEGTVITVTADSAIIDIGFKSEGILPLTAFQATGHGVKPGDRVPVSVKGRDPEGYYELTLFRTEQPKDWTSLERAFAEKAAIVGTVTGVVKGGVSVDVGVRAFMPASRSGARDAAELEKLVGQEIRCRIIKLDVADEDVVVDRRVLAEEEEKTIKARRYSEIKEGDQIHGVVRSLTSYGAFVDLGGVDALLHVSDISWSRVNQPGDVLVVGQQVDAQVLKVDAEKRRISIGIKQLQPHPWDAIAQKLSVGQRVRGTVSRVVEFGAFVEVEPGVEGLIHVTEMSWAKKVRIASDVVKPGETVDAVILGINVPERRISLGLKQALGDPWVDVVTRLSVGSVIEGPVTNLQKFGAFIQLAEGVEGMVHIGDMSVEKRLNHPSDMLRVGQVVKAQVLGIDADKRQLRLGMKQLVPSGLDEYIAEHKVGDTVTGRTIEVSGDEMKVELGEGVVGLCHMGGARSVSGKEPISRAGDITSLSAMLNARWKSGSVSGAKAEPARAGEVRSFRITRLDASSKKIELEPV
jgi:small subunit ribosomal protein S1